MAESDVIIRLDGSLRQIQFFIRRSGLLLALFVAVEAAVNLPWRQAVAVAALTFVYIAYNLYLCHQRIPDKYGDFTCNLGLCAALTYAGAEFSGVLYQVLLLLRVVRERQAQAERAAGVVIAVYIAAFVGAAPGWQWQYVWTIAYHVLVLGILTVAALYLQRLVWTQQRQAEAVKELALQRKRQEERAVTDDLTGLFNYRAYQECTGNLAAYSLLLLDIDHFKRLNDTYGHAVGNVVLRQLGAILRRSIRKEDLAFRYGGEEFAVLLMTTDLAAACERAQVIRRQVAAADWGAAAAGLQVTLSIGVAVRQNGEAERQVFEAADAALYAAKKSGRNAVRCQNPFAGLEDEAQFT